MFHHPRLVAVLLVGLCAGALKPAIAKAKPTVVSPAEEQAKKEAGTRFERGVKLYNAGDFTGALAEFEAAHAAMPRFEVLFNIGVAQKKLFRYGEAVRSLKRYLDEGGKKVPPDRTQLVQHELSEIRALVAEISVTVDGDSAELTIDGEPAGRTPLLEPLLVRAGRHVLRATRAGFEPSDKVLQIVSGVPQTIAIQLVRPNRSAALAVTTKPTGAPLFLDGKEIGRAPWKGTLDAGGHAISAELAGYHKNQLEVMLTAGQNRQIHLDLTALPKKTPVYKRWYLWVPIALVVAGGVTAAVLLTRTEPDVQIRYPGM